MDQVVDHSRVCMVEELEGAVGRSKAEQLMSWSAFKWEWGRTGAISRRGSARSGP